MQQTENYKLNLIDTDDLFGPEALNGNAQTLEAQLARLDAAITAETAARETAVSAEETARKSADTAEAAARVALDGVAARAAAGVYTGNGTNQLISLGFVPKMVCVLNEPGTSFNGVAVTGRPVKYGSVNTIAIEGSGFRVTFVTNGATNGSNAIYRYFAVG